MAKDWLRYDQLVEDALRGVVRRVLREVADNGLQGDHHFYLTFHTREPGVMLSPALRGKYPREMTVVLQHQFWALDVGEEQFSVTLSFGGKHEKLVIPFRSIISFADPSEKFGLQFESGMELEDSEDDLAEPSPEKEGDNRMPDHQPAAPQSAKVVTLDAFRKK
jgi:hypothetical protein